MGKTVGDTCGHQDGGEEGHEVRKGTSHLRWAISIKDSQLAKQSVTDLQGWVKGLGLAGGNLSPKP